jgi:hypothetical protein
MSKGAQFSTGLIDDIFDPVQGPPLVIRVNRNRLRKMSLVQAQKGLSLVFRDLKLRPFLHIQFIDDQDDFNGRVRPFAQSIDRLKSDNCA